MNSSAGGGTGVVINWPDDVGIGATAAAADDDDDLHAGPRLFHSSGDFRSVARRPTRRIIRRNSRARVCFRLAVQSPVVSS